MRNLLHIIILSAVSIACGQQNKESFNGVSSQSSSDHTAELSKQLNDQGNLQIPNKLAESWDGARLLGNQNYDLVALD